MRVCVFLDLDDTLFQTLPKCPPEQERRPAAFDRDGAPNSFMTGKQVRLLEMFEQSAEVIPVTARNLDAFRRVRVPFCSLAILDFGGVVLRPDGSPDRDWEARIRPQAEAAGGTLHALLESVQEFIARQNLGVNARLIHDLGMPLYIVMKHPDANEDALARIRAEHLSALVPKLPFGNAPPRNSVSPDLSEFFLHQNSNNLSIVPRFLGKEHAVAYVLEKHFADVISIGVGDSLSDVPFLRRCDFLMMPSGSQLAQALQADR
ncbi:MAG: hypothetical protein L0Y70_21300 [Gemmataceae bacterium]|nr:hypothetical protein [Gemmataceae bacterium]